MTKFVLQSLNKDSEGRVLVIRAKLVGVTEHAEYYLTEGSNALVIGKDCVEIDTHHGCIYKYVLLSRN